MIPTVNQQAIRKSIFASTIYYKNHEHCNIGIILSGQNLW